MKILRDKLDINFIKSEFASYSAKLQNNLNDIKLKLKDIPQTNFELGLHHLHNGNLKDAEFRFKFVTYFRPENKIAYYYLARTQLNLGKIKNAAASMNQVNSNVENINIGADEIKYINDKLNDPDNIKNIPQPIKADNINIYLNDVEELILKNAQLRKAFDDKQVLLCNKILKKISEEKPFLDILAISPAAQNFEVQTKFFDSKNAVNKIDVISINQNILDKISEFNFKTTGKLSLIDDEDFFKSKVDTKYNLVFITKSLNYSGNLDSYVKNLKNILHSNAVISVNIKTDKNSNDKLNIETDEFYYTCQTIIDKFGAAKFDLVEKFNFSSQKEQSKAKNPISSLAFKNEDSRKLENEAEFGDFLLLFKLNK